MPETSRPQTTFTRALGSAWPPVLIMPSTSVAESPEVTKNTSTSKVATAGHQGAGHGQRVEQGKQGAGHVGT